MDKKKCVCGYAGELVKLYANSYSPRDGSNEVHIKSIDDYNGYAYVCPECWTMKFMPINGELLNKKPQALIKFI